MTHYFDVFNGDADGICALHQLRLAQPQAATLITGVKRDISLLQQVSAEAGDQVTVLDIAMSKNQAALLDLLERDVHVRYFDHHIPGEIPQHPRLDAHIDTDANVCTSLLVNRYLNGAHLIWAVVAAFGDNMAQAARQAAVPLGLLDSQLDALRTLGECINYNGYGDTLADLYYPPAELYAIVHAYADPFALMREEPAYRVLSNGYNADILQAQALPPMQETVRGAVYLLPDAAWSRRVSGVFGNWLATTYPARAHAVLSHKPGGGYVVSVRAPQTTQSGADVLCSAFATGGGRRGAAGINHLADAQLDDFVRQFFQHFSR
ncbi:acetyltransferase [Sulfuriferula sp.]|uniref:acetyltransferase n=1 Tax=Sulfuriferula sp. TaxID=2025307 RepID=UPI002731B168|nr:acetyltransferase [Sulfuriferula sp.]MDP2027420.1 acetyltransferase [Sulfuriferula sp.]